MTDPESGDAMAGRLLRDTAALVSDDRDTHGDAVVNQEHIAAGWTWYLQGAGLIDSSQSLDGADVARMMTLVKHSRGAVGSYDIDHDRDVAGYAAIAAACEISDGNADREDLVVASEAHECPACETEHDDWAPRDDKLECGRCGSLVGGER